MGGRARPVRFFRLGAGAVARGAGGTIPRALGFLGTYEEGMVRDCMRASSAAHCGVEFLMGLRWRTYVAAMGEARKMYEEAGGAGT